MDAGVVDQRVGLEGVARLGRPGGDQASSRKWRQHGALAAERLEAEHAVRGGQPHGGVAGSAADRPPPGPAPRSGRPSPRCRGRWPARCPGRSCPAPCSARPGRPATARAHRTPRRPPAPIPRCAAAGGRRSVPPPRCRRGSRSAIRSAGVRSALRRRATSSSSERRSAPGIDASSPASPGTPASRSIRRTISSVTPRLRRSRRSRAAPRPLLVGQDEPALELALAIVEVQAGRGCRSRSPAWPRRARSGGPSSTSR